MQMCRGCGKKFDVTGRISTGELVDYPVANRAIFCPFCGRDLNSLLPGDVVMVENDEDEDWEGVFRGWNEDDTGQVLYEGSGKEYTVDAMNIRF